ncbi:MAG: hypothetical protein SGJ09_05225 [Phycisphaerae bacterium]|nr:hypothetical protein [Phycisphaerae bacterium]
MATVIPDLRCERCAYDLAGTSCDGACPECGTAVAASLPEARLGIPWQRDPSFTTWCSTFWATLTSPRRTARALRIERGRARWLIAVNVAVGATLSLIPAVVTLFRGPRNITIELPTKTIHMFWDVSFMTGSIFGLLLPLGLLTTVALGANFYARRRSPPMHGEVVWANQAMSSYAFVIIGVVTMLSWSGWRAIAPVGVVAASTAPSQTVLMMLQLAPAIGCGLGAIFGAAVDWITKSENHFANVVRAPRVRTVDSHVHSM